MHTIDQPCVECIDHIVLTVQNIERTCHFYTTALGMEKRVFGDNRVALHFATQKINLHEQGHEIKPNARHALPGTIDLCLLSKQPVEILIRHLDACGIKRESDIVDRSGALGPIRSFYLRDPDGNLLEISNSMPSKTAQNDA